MKKVFLTYARENQAFAAAIAEDLESVDYSVWFDRELTGGQAWWDQVLLSIRESDVLIVVLTPASLDSEACKLEWAYASRLGKYILPVLVSGDVDLTLVPHALAKLQHVDRRSDDKRSLISLLRAMTRLHSAPPLPETLPAPPPAPMSYLGGMKEEVTSSQELSRREQWDLVGRLKVALRDAKNADPVVRMLRQLQARVDTLAVVSAEIEEVLRVRAKQTPSSTSPADEFVASSAQAPLTPSAVSRDVGAKLVATNLPGSPGASDTSERQPKALDKSIAEPSTDAPMRTIPTSQRSTGVRPTATPLPMDPTSAGSAPIAQSDVVVMSDLGITYDGRYYHFEQYRYEQESDAINYAKLVRGRGERKGK